MYDGYDPRDEALYGVDERNAALYGTNDGRSEERDGEKDDDLRDDARDESLDADRDPDRDDEKNEEQQRLLDEFYVRSSPDEYREVCEDLRSGEMSLEDLRNEVKARSKYD